VVASENPHHTSTYVSMIWVPNNETAPMVSIATANLVEAQKV